jgi:hypothetical protein
MRSDAKLLRAFEDYSLPEAEFHHATHIRVVWLYLQHLADSVYCSVPPPAERVLGGARCAPRPKTSMASWANSLSSWLVLKPS